MHDQEQVMMIYDVEGISHVIKFTFLPRISASFYSVFYTAIVIMKLSTETQMYDIANLPPVFL